MKSVLTRDGCIAVAILAILLSTRTASAADSHGLGDHYNWVELDEGYELAKASSKPLMLLIHKSWCGACKALKPRFKSSQPIEQLSPNFIMVNVMDDEEPEGDMYQPDGGYIPRILFFNPDGELMDVINEDGNPKYKYYYSDDAQIADSMRRAVGIYGGGDEEEKSGKNASKTEL